MAGGRERDGCGEGYAVLTRAVVVLLLLAALATAADLGSEFLAAVSRGDSLYRRAEYQRALGAYESAHAVLEQEPGPLVGAGWCRLMMADYAQAETLFRAALRIRPEPQATAGLKLLPLYYRFRLTGTWTDDFGVRRSFSGFVEYNHHFRTTVTLGAQGVLRGSGWGGFNTALVVYRRLRYPWSVRFDFLTLSANQDPRYWRLVYAPSLGYAHRGWSLRAAFVGWDRLGTAGLMLDGERILRPGLVVGAAPALNVSGGKFGFLVPVNVEWAALSWLTARASAGAGSIADHVDFEVPTLYNQAQRLTTTARVGADFLPVPRLRVSVFGAWERYDNKTGGLYASLAASVKL
jgi:hypothetical protein